MNAAAKEIVFTSGATESDNLAILGVARLHRERGGHVITAPTEHNAVLDPCRQLEREGFTVTYLEPAKGTGEIRPDQVRAALREETVLVSLMLANNEVGTVQQVAAIGAICREKNVLFHTDAVQGFGKIPFDVQAMNVDLASVSAHKIYGPKGVGALYARSRNPHVRLEPIVFGGGHERGMRSGTLNVPGIVGLGRAAELAVEEMAEEGGRLRLLRKRLWDGLRAKIDDVVAQRSAAAGDRRRRGALARGGGAPAPGQSQRVVSGGGRRGAARQHEGRGRLVGLGLHVGLARALARPDFDRRVARARARFDPFWPRTVEHGRGNRLRDRNGGQGRRAPPGEVAAGQGPVVALSGATLASLAAMPDRLEAAFRLIPAEHRNWMPPSWEGIPGERFSPLGQICHVRDIERLGYHVRIARMLAEEGPSLAPLDGYGLAEGLDYGATDPGEALDAFRIARASTLRVLESVTAEQLDRRGTFAEYGPLTLRSLVHYLASHDHQHLACMDWLLGKLHAEAARPIDSPPRHHPVLTELARGLPSYADLLGRVRGGEDRLVVSGGVGALPAILLAALSRDLGRPLAIVVSNEKEAERLVGDLAASGMERVFHAPAPTLTPVPAHHRLAQGAARRIHAPDGVARRRPGLGRRPAGARALRAAAGPGAVRGTVPAPVPGIRDLAAPRDRTADAPRVPPLGSRDRDRRPRRARRPLRRVPAGPGPRRPRRARGRHGRLAAALRSGHAALEGEAPGSLAAAVRGGRGVGGGARGDDRADRAAAFGGRAQRLCACGLADALGLAGPRGRSADRHLRAGFRRGRSRRLRRAPLGRPGSGPGRVRAGGAHAPRRTDPRAALRRRVALRPARPRGRGRRRDPPARRTDRRPRGAGGRGGRGPVEGARVRRGGLRRLAPDRRRREAEAARVRVRIPRLLRAPRGRRRLRRRGALGRVPAERAAPRALHRGGDLRRGAPLVGRAPQAERGVSLRPPGPEARRRRRARGLRHRPLQGIEARAGRGPGARVHGDRVRRGAHAAAAGRAPRPRAEVLGRRGRRARARPVGRRRLGQAQGLGAQGDARHDRPAAEALRATQPRRGVRVLQGRALAEGVRGRLRVRRDARPGAGDRRRQARHAVGKAHGPAAVRRRRVRQDGGRHARRLQGGPRRQAGRRAGADDDPRRPALPHVPAAVRRRSRSRSSCSRASARGRSRRTSSRASRTGPSTSSSPRTACSARTWRSGTSAF